MAYILGYVINNGNTPDVPEVNKPVINIQSSRVELYTDQNLSVSILLGVSIENPVDGVNPTFSATGLPAGLEIQNGYIVGAPNETGIGTATITISYPGAASKEIYVDYQVYAVWIRGTENDTTFDLTVDEEFEHPIDWKLSNNGKVNFTIYDGKLPTGLELSEDGIIYGTPTTAETCTCRIQIDANGPIPAPFELTLHFNVLSNSNEPTEPELGETIQYIVTTEGSITNDYQIAGNYVQVAGIGNLINNPDDEGTYILLTDSGNKVFKNTETDYYLIANNHTGNYGFCMISNYVNNAKYPEVIYTEDFGLGSDPDNLNGEYRGGNLIISKPSNTPTDKTYVYTVTGASSEYQAFNGDYYDTGELYSNKSMYKNDNGMYLAIWEYMNGPTWGLYNDKPNGEIAPSIYETTYAAEPDDTNASWLVQGGLPEDNLKVTKVQSEKTYLYTVSNAGIADANGDYYDSGKVKEFSEGNSSKVYENDNGWELYYDYDMWFWTLSSEAFTLQNGIAYSGPGDSSAPPTGTYSDFNAGDGTSPVVTEYSGGGSKEYKYTVSGATGGKSGANGDYWQIAPPANINSNYDQSCGVFTNGTWYLVYCANYWNGWCLTTDISVDPVTLDGTDNMIAPGSSNPTTPISLWAMVGITVAEYAG